MRKVLLSIATIICFALFSNANPSEQWCQDTFSGTWYVCDGYDILEIPNIIAAAGCTGTYEIKIKFLPDNACPPV